MAASRGARPSSASRRASWTASPMACCRRRTRPSSSCWSRSGSIPPPPTRPPCGQQTATPSGGRSPTRSRTTARPRSASSSISATARPTRSTRASNPLRLASIETRAYRLPLDPPFFAAWDPEPRTELDATLTIVTADGGSVGYASGDALPGRAALERHLRGVDLRDAEAVNDICRTVDFHGGRTWTCEVAVWDLVGRAAGEPLWRMLGARNDSLTAYASTGERVATGERVRRCLALREAGWRAVKLRVGSDGPAAAAETVAAVREAVGPGMAIMVDVNQGWRMPGDRTPAWDVGTATELARALEPLDVHWLEEPLPCADVDAYAELKRATGIRIAAGEMVRTEHEARDLIVRGGVDVIQCD